MQPFKAYLIEQDEHRKVSGRMATLAPEQLDPGEVLIRVHSSSINYKDALAATGAGKIIRRFPCVGGIDLSGEVVESTDTRFRAGDRVIATSYDIGVAHHGGYAEYARIPAGWVIPLPDGLDLHEAMALGTAGFTAALGIVRMEDNGLQPANGPVVVTGATGGVGSVALLLLHQLGYEAVAVTGKESAHAFLRSLGAASVLDRRELLKDRDKPLLAARWAGVVDTVGGDLLATAIKSTGFDGVVTLCGNAASADLPISVYPFILRGVHLVGIYSANSPMERRLRVWEKLAGEWQLDLGPISRVVSLYRLEEEIMAMLAGRTTGRCVVDLEATT